MIWALEADKWHTSWPLPLNCFAKRAGKLQKTSDSASLSCRVAQHGSLSERISALFKEQSYPFLMLLIIYASEERRSTSAH